MVWASIASSLNNETALIDLNRASTTRKCDIINDALPLEAARRDVIAKVKFFCGFESQLQTNPLPFHLDSPEILKLVT